MKTNESATKNKRQEELTKLVMQYEGEEAKREPTPSPTPSTARKEAVKAPATPSNEDDIRGGWERRTFICHPRDVQCLRMISVIDRKPIKQILHEAFCAYIKVWSTAHEGIDIDMFNH